MTPFENPTRAELAARIQTFLDNQDTQGALALLQEEHPSDIATLLEALDEKHRVALFALLQPEAAAEVLDEIGMEATLELVEAIPDENIADLLEEMSVDDAAELLSDLPDARAEEILSLVEPEEAADIGTLLAYPEDTAGRLMNTDVVRLREDWTVGQTLEHLRTVDPEAELLAYLYVTDERNYLVGVLPLHNLVTCKPEKRISELIEREPVVVQAYADQEEAARLVGQYDFFALPVVGDSGELLGVITHDDVVDILEEEFTEDIQRLGGSQPLEEEYLATPILTVFQKRVGWLLILFLTAQLTGTVMRHFETELSTVVALSFFIPLLIGTGGNSGSQTTSTIVRAVAMGEAQFRDAGRLLWHEFRIGILLGTVMGVIGYVRAILWDAGQALAWTVAIALFSVVLWANVAGSLLPVLADRLHIDPAVISGPVMSTLVDAAGLLIYFLLARSILGL